MCSSIMRCILLCSPARAPRAALLERCRHHCGPAQHLTALPAPCFLRFGASRCRCWPPPLLPPAPRPPLAPGAATTRPSTSFGTVSAARRHCHTDGILTLHRAAPARRIARRAQAHPRLQRSHGHHIAARSSVVPPVHAKRHRRTALSPHHYLSLSLSLPSPPHTLDPRFSVCSRV